HGFSNDILSTSRVSLNAKVDIIRNIFKKIDDGKRLENKIKGGDFKKWVEIRNVFAHGELMSYNGEEKLRYNGQLQNIYTLSEKFQAINRKVSSALIEYHDDLAGENFSTSRVKA